MFRKTSGAILCPSCGRLTNADAAVCLVCGRRRPGLWGFAGPLRALFRRSFTDVVTIACIVLYVASLVIDPSAALRSRGLFSLFSPSGAALSALGGAGAAAWEAGRWWTLVTAIYLHGGVLHILFNLLWIRQLGPAVEEIYGPARLVVIFTAAGAAGFMLSTLVGHWLTVGASGSIFGLLGALVAYGYRRGGTYGTLMLKQYGQWALILFVFGLLPGTGIDNWAHAGGFAGGFVTAWVLSFAERQNERGVDHLLAAAALGVTVLGFVLALWTAFVG
ncbi:MAG TPA: rhomboid family intramembrane serine protease [Candidatus Tectomicrobia bacterium]|nr:rhomboid family intramembrane serine protease [Candidatus Tectomicrobia bacterium]